MTITLQDIQFRRNTSTYYTANNPLLALGEPAFETDTNKLKIGNGVDNWNNLSYITGSGGTGAVDSVNGETGVIVLTTDDIEDVTAVNKYVTQAQLDKINAIQGVNTGDQDISGIATNASGINALETGLAANVAATALNTAKNSYPSSDALKVSNLPSDQNSINLNIEARVAINDNKTGITGAQASAITANTAKVSYPGDQDASTVNLTSNINGQSTVQASLEDHESRIDTLSGAGSGTGDMLSANNLSDLDDSDAAISNLGITATASELNFVDGVTSNIQTQIDSKVDWSTPINSNITADTNNAYFLFSDSAAPQRITSYEFSTRRGGYTAADPRVRIQSGSIYLNQAYLHFGDSSETFPSGIVNGFKMSSDGKIMWKKSGDTFQIWQGLDHNNTAPRTAIFPDKDGTVAFLDDIPGSGGVSTDNQNKIDNSILPPKTLAKNSDFTLALSDSYNDIASDSDIGRSYIMEVNDAGTTIVTVPSISGSDNVWKFRNKTSSDVFDIIPDDGVTLDWEGKTTENAVRLTGRKEGLVFMRQVSSTEYFLDGDITGFSYATNLMLTGTQGDGTTHDGMANSSTSPNYTITDDGTNGGSFDKYVVTIDIATAGLNIGDTIQIQADSISGGTSPRVQVNLNDASNNEIATINSSTLSDSGVIPSGTTTLTIWFLPNYNSTNDTTATYTNVTLIKL